MDVIQKARVQLDSQKLLLSQRQERLEELTKEQETIDRAQRLCQSVAKQTQENLSVQLSGLINLALETCFPGQYTFNALFVENRGKTELKFVLVDNKTSQPDDDILSGFGGGLVDVVSLALRLCLHTLEKGDNLIVLDEPFKFLSVDLRPKAAQLLKELSHKLNLQFVIVTHIPEIEEVADKLFRVQKIDGVSVVSEEGL